MKVTNSKKAKKQTELQKLLEKHKDEFKQLQNGKIKCSVTEHQFMPTEQNVLAHLSSKSYKKASEAQFDISQYQAILSTHKDDENFLFCRLTGAKIPKKKTAISKHVNGKRFKSRFQQYKTQIEQEGEEQIEEQNEEEGEEVEDDVEEQVDQEEVEEQEEEEEQEEVEEEAKIQEQKQNGEKKPVPVNNNNSHSKKSKKNKVKQLPSKKRSINGVPGQKKNRKIQKARKQGK